MMLSNKQDDIALYEVEAPHYEPVEHDAPPRYVAQPDGSYRRTSPATGRAVINCVGDMLVERNSTALTTSTAKRIFTTYFSLYAPYLPLLI